MHVFSSLFKTSHISVKYRVESIAGNILCWVKKPDYISIRKKLIKSKCIDDNTGFMIISKDIFISRSDNTIMIIFQDFKQIFNINKMFSLEKLKLTRNLDHLELLSQLGYLTKLSLSSNKLTNVPSEIGKLTSLTRLDLSYNMLTNLPSEIGNLTNLTNLTQLDLNYNELINIPSEIGNLTNLDILYLSYNQLTNVPFEIGKLTNLAILSLHNNKLTSIPSEIGKLTNLTDLYLNNNKLTNIPSEIGKLTNLDVLYLYCNQLTYEFKIQIKSWFKNSIRLILI